jgi:predicted metal-binding protein
LKEEALALERVKWDAVVLVCKTCRKRSSAPKRLKPKALAGALRKALKNETPRPRILMTGCLSVCPKAATAVAFVGRDGAPRVVAIKSSDQVEEAARLLRGPAAG